MIKPQAFTLKGKGRLNVLKTPCGVSEAFDPKSGGKHPEVKQYTAIWDTGATSTVITEKVANELGLSPTGFVTSHHAGGTSKVPTYIVNIFLPNGINIPGIRVIQATLSAETEILIGMDIISHGDFAFTNEKGNSCFTFRIPSVKQIDYLEGEKDIQPLIQKTPGRNEPCFCGSKKKYKHCHGKKY